MESLRTTSLQAEKANFVVAAITAHIGARLGVSAECIVDIPWQERESLLDAGQIQAAWICGLPYVRKADRADPRIELLAAPVMQGARYEDRPVYFSDVVVRRGRIDASAIHSTVFEEEYHRDLRSSPAGTGAH